MTTLYPIVLETETTGAGSAYVPGLPVYTAANTHAAAEGAIRALLAAYLDAHPASQPKTRVRVARVSGKGKVDVIGRAHGDYVAIDAAADDLQRINDTDRQQPPRGPLSPPRSTRARRRLISAVTRTCPSACPASPHRSSDAPGRCGGTT